MMKRSLIGRLIACLLICALHATVACAETTPHPLACVVCTDLHQVTDSAQLVFIGIPLWFDGETCVLTNEDVYAEGEVYYVGGLGKSDEGGAFLMELYSRGSGMTLFRANADAEISAFYSQREAPVEGGEYTLVGVNETGDIERRSVTIAQVNSQANSDGFYEASLSGVSFEGLYAPAAIVSGDRLVAFSSNAGAFAFLPASESGVQPTEQPTQAPTEQPASPTSAPDNAPGSSDTPSRERAEEFPWKAAALIAGGAMALIGLSSVCLSRHRRKKAAVPAGDASSPTLPVDAVRAPLQAAQAYCLQAVGGSLDGMLFPVPETGLLIGRAMEADVRYEADTKGVSRNHCRVFRQGDRLCVVDLGSTSGTYLSDQGRLTPNAPAVLREGVVIYLGSKQIGLQVCARMKGGYEP